MNWRKHLEYWTVTRVNFEGELKEVTCCCADPGMSGRSCALKGGRKTTCQCVCHKSPKLWGRYFCVAVPDKRLIGVCGKCGEDIVQRQDGKWVHKPIKVER